MYHYLGIGSYRPKEFYRLQLWVVRRGEDQVDAATYNVGTLDFVASDSYYRRQKTSNCGRIVLQSEILQIGTKELFQIFIFGAFRN